MFRPLHERQRKRLLELSAMLCTVPLLLAPLAAQSSIEAEQAHLAFDAPLIVPQTGGPWRRHHVQVQRDPFAAEATPNAPAGAPAPDVFAPVLPANAGAVGTPVMGNLSVLDSGLPQVRAVVTGASARALIEEGSDVRVAGIGDPLAGSRIAAIDSHGVRLRNGAFLALNEGEP